MACHKVCVITCPHCGHEKPITHLDSRCIVIFQCKKCKKQCRAVRNQECFEFEGIEPVNAT